MYRVLFVCTGNICRSPTAEGFFRHQLRSSPLSGRVETDSAGTGSWHLGSSPDHRAVTLAQDYGVDLSSLRARRVTRDDFRTFDLLIAMDDSHHRDLARLGVEALGEAGGARLHRMMEFARGYPNLADVPDPYYGTEADFRYMCELLDDATRGLVAHLEGELGAA